MMMVMGIEPLFYLYDLEIEVIYIRFMTMRNLTQVRFCSMLL